MKVISMTTGKSGPEIIMALGTWSGTEFGGLEQLQSSDDAMTQLKGNFMLDDTEVEEAQLGETADTEAHCLRLARHRVQEEEGYDGRMRKDKFCHMWHLG